MNAERPNLSGRVFGNELFQQSTIKGPKSARVVDFYVDMVVRNRSSFGKERQMHPYALMKQIGEREGIVTIGRASPNGDGQVFPRIQQRGVRAATGLRDAEAYAELAALLTFGLRA